MSLMISLIFLNLFGIFLIINFNEENTSYMT